jgi:hypothetical protein
MAFRSFAHAVVLTSASLLFTQTASADRSVPASPPVQPAPAATAAPLAPTGAAQARDYIDDAKLFYRVVACSGTAPLPAAIEAKTIEKHCAEMQKRFTRIAEKYATPARAFFADKKPANMPSTVVYPFGGGDLLSALVTYPEAREITTMSLEHAGDPTRLAKLDNKKLKAELGVYRNAIEGLLGLNDSTTDNMQKMERGGIPGQLSFHLTGMAAMGFEPVSLKFFSFEDDGRIHYLSADEITALAPKIAKKKKGIATNTDFSEAFSNMELTFRKAGDASAPLIVHRHISANLADNVFAKSPLLKHLEAKGDVAAITKAASYLLWFDSFSTIRNYLASHLVWMASDATGIPSRVAKKAGLVQTTYGSFTGAFLEDAQGTAEETNMVDMWSKQPKRKLPFRYGYPDVAKTHHLMITERARK